MNLESLHLAHFGLPTTCLGQANAWQSATLLPIRCKLVPPVPSRVEEPISPLRQSFSGSAMNNPTFSQEALSQHEKVGYQNWHSVPIAYFAAGGEND